MRTESHGEVSGPRFMGRLRFNAIVARPCEYIFPSGSLRSRKRAAHFGSRLPLRTRNCRPRMHNRPEITYLWVGPAPRKTGASLPLRGTIEASVRLSSPTVAARIVAHPSMWANVHRPSRIWCNAIHLRASVTGSFACGISSVLAQQLSFLFFLPSGCSIEKTF